jgi:hypothetical protein
MSVVPQALSPQTEELYLKLGVAPGASAEAGAYMGRPTRLVTSACVHHCRHRRRRRRRPACCRRPRPDTYPLPV